MRFFRNIQTQLHNDKIRSKFISKPASLCYNRHRDANFIQGGRFSGPAKADDRADGTAQPRVGAGAAPVRQGGASEAAVYRRGDGLPLLSHHAVGAAGPDTEHEGVRHDAAADTRLSRRERRRGAAKTAARAGGPRG